MLTTARPIFESVPGSFCDPVGLADQQAQGVVALIVATYPVENQPAPPSQQSNNAPSPPSQGGVPRADRPAKPTGEGVSIEPPSSTPVPLGPVYDAFVAVSGQLLAVARSTPDYRFPVQPATALRRFIDARDAHRPVFLSLFELDEDDCARFLETVFFSECLKLHVDGVADLDRSAALIAHQITHAGCGDGLPSGVLEINDFSDPTAPRVRLIDLASTGIAGELCDTNDLPFDKRASPQGEGALADALRPHLDGVTGRVLLYDRAKNHAVLPDRTGHGFDLGAAIEQANRLALARRGDASIVASGDAPARAMHRAAAELRASADDDQTEAVETYLRERAERPCLVSPDHPHASALGTLVAELQGRTPKATLPTAADLESSATDQLSTTETLPSNPSTSTPLGEQSANENSPPSQGGVPAAGRGGGPTPPNPHTPTPGPETVRRHPLATELDRLRCDVVALFEDAVTRERALAHESHILTEHAIPSPVPPDRTPEYLRALLTDDPPRRWHFFKRQRGKTYHEVAGKLLAFHAAHSHLDAPEALRAVHDLTKLWTRLHK